MHRSTVLRYIHPIGSRISGIVIDRTPLLPQQEGYLIQFERIAEGYLTLETSSKFPAKLHYSLLPNPFRLTEEMIPEIGTRIDAVVQGFGNDTLYLSARPQDLEEEKILAYEKLYATLDEMEIGDTITGTVRASVHFGLFVDLGILPYIGLIEIVASKYLSGYSLPRDRSEWPKMGDRVRGTFGAIRIENHQIYLGWLPDDESIRKVESTDSEES